MTSPEPSFDVLCMGEALWDLHTPEGVPFATAEALSMRPGGAAVNVALGLAKHGLRVALSAVVGDEALGEALVQRVQSAGVDVRFVQRALARTAVLFAEHGAMGSRFVGYRAVDEPAPRWPRALRARALLLTGVMPLAAHAAVFRAAARSARRRGACVVVDVNARPRVWRGRDGAAALEVIREADVVKASAEDVAVLGLDADTALRAHLRRRAVLVTTAGAGPARAFGPFGEVTAKGGRPIQGPALGAGDAFTAGMLSALLAGEPRDDAEAWRRVLRRGHALARAHLRGR
ncbi:Fructokinase [Minicystis rosea]|nr:Fructokinase [Minicystis rosea]